MSDIKARIMEYARKECNMGMTYFERYTGINIGTISKIKPSGGISTNTLASIAQKCPNLNLRWLLSGEGTMITESTPNGLKSAENEDIISRNTDVLLSQQETIKALTELLTKKL